jgi:signal transduction histidine kinase
MKDATIRLTNFINNILDLAKIKAGKFEIRRTQVNVSDLAHEIVSLFESLAAQQGKKLTYEAVGETPPIEVDPEKIKQVITNLIGNAMKFTPAGAEIKVSSRAVKPQGSNIASYIEVWIADTGIGIPPEAVGKVFDKFFQVQESENKKPKGTGLGLAIVAEIIKLHDGKIWVESTLGKGSVFKFLLPVTRRA